MIPRGKPRSRITPEEFDEICNVFRYDLFTQANEIARRYNVSMPVIVRALQHVAKTEGASRVELRAQVVREFWKKNPNASDDDFARRFNVSRDTAGHLRRTIVDAPRLKQDRATREKIYKLVGFLSEEVRKRRDLQGNALLDHIAKTFGVPRDALKAFLASATSAVDVETRLRFFEPATPAEETRVLNAVDNLAQECFESKENPSARVRTVLESTERNRELKMMIPVKYGSRSFLTFCQERIADYMFYAKRTIRPEAYVADVTSRGYPGAFLPEENFDVYLQYYLKRRARYADADEEI